MPRQAKPKPVDLTINPKVPPQKSREGDSPDPRSSPMNLEGIDLSSFGGDIGLDVATLPPLPQSPPIPQTSPPQSSHKRDPSKNFLNNFKTRTSPEQQEQRGQIRQAKDDEELRPSSSSMSKIYHLRKNPGSTPELSLVGSGENVHKQSNDVNRNTTQTPDSRPEPSPHPSEDAASVRRKDKGFRNPLSRSKSIRRDSHSKSKPNGKPSMDQPPKTAPISTDWPGAPDRLRTTTKAKDRRGKSAERAVASESEDNPMQERPATIKEKSGTFVTGSKHVMSKAVTGGGHLLNRLGKIGRSTSATERDREIPDNEYVLKIINLPLVEQTRATRISKDLAKCRDKTEYWMPSLPWRCIDYLNLHCEAEGLYRIPGSGPQVKHWQRRFDTELDVDLLDEEELYDPNNIGSMLKSWLRDLPTEIMPKHIQHDLAKRLEKENPDYQKIGQPVPKLLKDTLKLLPPFNYYLLFAITCHLSLMLQNKEKNKMDLNNLMICIGPCLDLERWLFNYLVGEWKHCWEGCDTEKMFLDAERAYEQGYEYVMPDISALTTNAQRKESEGAEKGGEERAAVYSSGTASVGSYYSDARSAQGSPRPVPHENVKPGELTQLLLQSKYGGGGVASANGTPEERERRLGEGGVVLDERRPATAHGSKVAVGDGGGSGVVSGTATPPPPKLHTRSKSDFQLSPVSPSSPVDFPFVVQKP